MAATITDGIERSRSNSIVRVSIVGIIVNLILVAFKATVGILTNSISVIIDAVNNLTDAGSSAVTIIGTKLSSKKPNRKHPYGYGRIEYLTTILVGAIIVSAGLNSLQESAERIIRPEESSYTLVSLIIIGVGVAVKVALGLYFRRAGELYSSDTLTASGTDSLTDSMISFSTLVAAIIFMVFGINLESWLGLVISAVIIKAGVEILIDSLSGLLGERIDDDLAIEIKETAMGVQGVRGAYDLAINDYGPERLSGSIHIEVDDKLTAQQIDEISRKVQEAVFEKTHIILHTVGIYCSNTDESAPVSKIRAELQRIKEHHPHLLEVHGLYVNEETGRVSFDSVISFEADDPVRERDAIIDEISAAFPEYTFSSTIDTDISAIDERGVNGA